MDDLPSTSVDAANAAAALSGPSPEASSDAQPPLRPDTVLNNPKAQALCRRLEQLDRDRRIDALLRWLGGKEALRREIAVATLAPAGAPALRLLLGEALKPRKREETRVRLLEAVEQMGVPLPPEQFLDLTVLANRFGPAVQRQIAQVVVANRQAYLAQQERQAQAGLDPLARPLEGPRPQAALRTPPQAPCR